MAENSRSGKLVVMLHADIAGSTDLVRRDEQLAHQRIQGTFRRLSDTITRYHGHVRELRGDALLAEFDRASDAVSAALASQAEQAKFIEQLSDDVRPLVRVGIAMGEVIIADNMVTGEGVVLAQRLEQLADPGAVVIQGAAYETIPGRFPFDYHDLGEHDVKGFDQPVKVFEARLKRDTDLPQPAPMRRDLKNWIRTAASIGIVLAVLALIWLKPWESRIQPPPMDHVVIPLPDKPSIAVLPFEDLSPEAPRKSLADGLTETLTSTLGQVSDLFVTARNSVMGYKGQATDIRKIGRQLGVRYVLEGSVQQTTDKVRVTAQLVDTTTGGHLWAERYDRPLDDIFLLQDEIALKVLVSLQVHLTDGEVARLRSSTTKNVDAYLLYQKAVEIFFSFTKEAMIETRRLMDEVLVLDPNFTSAMILKAWTHITDAENGYSESQEESIALAEAELEYMESLGQELNVLARGEAIMIRAYKELLRGNHEKAVELGKQSIALLPNHPDMLAILGLFLHYAGKNEHAIEVFQKAMRIDPNYKSWYAGAVSRAWILLEDYDAAEAAAHDAIKRAGKSDEVSLAFAHQSMAIVFTVRGDVEQGRKELQRALELAPWLSLEKYKSSLHLQDDQELELLVGALQNAGLGD